MAKLTITRGLPGSGKTTWAKQQQDAWRVNRDDLRAMFNEVWPWGDATSEGLITLMQEKLIAVLLDKDLHVIADDTNMRWQHVQALMNLAKGRPTLVQVEVKEFLHVPVETCIERDLLRPDPVGRTVIMDMFHRYMGDGDG